MSIIIKSLKKEKTHQTPIWLMRQAGRHLPEYLKSMLTEECIKEFGILDVAEEELSHFFPEMRKYLGQCKYNNCTHVNEPGCMVLHKLNEGYIHPYRYQSYLNILNEEDSHR